MKKILSALLIAIMMLSFLSVLAFAESSDADAIAVDTESALYKKRVLFCGDSICEASNDADGFAKYGVRGWAGRIMAWNDLTGRNRGKSAASISNCRGTNTILAQLKAQANGNYDFVILHGGVNDAWDNAPVGVMTEGFDGPFDESTYAGGLEATIKYAKETFEESTVAYILNFSLPKAKWGRISDMSEYFDLAKQICDKWEVPYLDLYSDDDFNNKVLCTYSTVYVPDTVHPNSMGYDLIAPVINDWMKELAADVEAKNESEANASSEASVTESVEPTVSEDSKSAEDASTPAYVYSIIVIAVAAVIGAVIIIVAKKKK